jgi:serine/threonine-protein kinase RsbW
MTNPPLAPGLVEMTICSSTQYLPVVRAAVGRMAEAEGFAATDAHALAWAIDEALANVIRHGYENQADQPIHLTLQPVEAADGRRGLRVVVRDFGRQVDPATIKSRDLEEVRPGGLGVHIIRSVMDEVEYSCAADCGMLLTMTKYVVPPAGSGGTPKAS